MFGYIYLIVLRMETFLDIAVQGIIPDYRPSPGDPRKDRRPCQVRLGHPSSISYREIKNKKELHRPGIEPEPRAWEARILPLNYRCIELNNVSLFR